VYLLLPQFSASVSGFGVLPFCFGLTLLGVAFYSDQPVQIASAALFVSLLRPDGVIFSLTLIVIAAIKSPTKKKTLFAFFLFYFVPGVIYFIWRANYFGEFLPLPFYVKSQADRFAGILVLESFVGIIPYFICCAIVFAYLKPLPRFPEPSFGLLVSFIIVPSCFYLYMNLTQNIGDRFFAYIPISLALIVARDWRLLDLKKAVAALLACLVVLLPKTCIALSNFRVFQFDNRRDMALALKRIGQGTMIVTEAGFLPYYSDWPTVDSWGLNSAEFAHRLIQPEDVKRLSPDIVMVHVDGTIEPTPQADWPRAYQKRSSVNIAKNLIMGATRDGYSGWVLPYGSVSYQKSHGITLEQGDVEYWYVYPRSRYYSKIVNIIRTHAGAPIEEFDKAKAWPVK
jgi:hypothetical protein